MTMTMPPVPPVQGELTASQQNLQNMKKDPERYAKHLKRSRRAHARHHEKLKADPMRHQAYLTKQAGYRTARLVDNPHGERQAVHRKHIRWYDKMKSDPVRYRAYLKKQSTRSKKYYAMIVNDPVLRAPFLEKRQTYNKTYLAKVRADPVKYQAYLEKARGYVAKNRDRISGTGFVAPTGHRHKSRIVEAKAIMAAIEKMADTNKAGVPQ